jgi:hypothetical protein
MLGICLIRKIPLRRNTGEHTRRNHVVPQPAMTHRGGGPQGIDVRHLPLPLQTQQRRGRRR